MKSGARGSFFFPPPPPPVNTKSKVLANAEGLKNIMGVSV